MGGDSVASLVYTDDSEEVEAFRVRGFGFPAAAGGLMLLACAVLGRLVGVEFSFPLALAFLGDC